MNEKIKQIEDTLHRMMLADFLDWEVYYNLKTELAALKAEG